MNKKKSLLCPCIVFAFLFACIMFSTFAYAKAAPCNKFEKKASGNVYYYDKTGKRVTGLVTIKGKKYYFDSKVMEHDIVFDYKIREGIGGKSNAIALLELLGYPREIVQKAREYAI